MVSIKVQNVVASTSIAEMLDLAMIDGRLADTTADTKYRPDEFPGLVLHLSQPQLAFLLFDSGKVVCTGGKTIEDIQTGVARMSDLLEKAGVAVIDNPNITVQNIVASADLGKRMNLTQTALGLGLENVEYEPEIFPGIVYRINDLGVVLLFSSGGLICTGVRTPEQASQAVNRLQDELQQKGLLG